MGLVPMSGARMSSISHERSTKCLSTTWHACGAISYKLDSKPYLDTVIRNLIMHKLEFLRDTPDSVMYRKMGPQLAKLKTVTEEMRAHQEKLKADGLAKKEVER